jgi:hypothetical protein
VLGCAKHLSPLLLHAAEATLIYLNVVKGDSPKFECDGYSGPPYSSKQILIRQP